MTKPNHHIFADGELSRNEGTLRIDTLDGDTKHLPIESVDALYLHGQIDFNTRALGLLNEHGVPLHVFGWKDYYRGSYLPKRGQTSGNTVVEQVRAYDDSARRLNISKQIIQASIHNMRANLRYYDGRRGEFSTAMKTLANENKQRQMSVRSMNFEPLRGTAAEHTTNASTGSSVTHSRSPNESLIRPATRRMRLFRF